MKKYVWLFCSIFLYSAVAFAAPKRVVLFPDSARVYEHSATKNIQEKQTLLLTLPGQADPASLRFEHLPANTALADIQWTSRREDTPQAAKALQKELLELEQQTNALLAERTGAQARLDFWKAQTKTQGESIARLEELAGAVERSTRKEKARILALTHKYEKFKKHIAILQKQITDIAGKQGSVWDIRVLLRGKTPAELAYSYTLRDCGWAPLYRFDAYPQKKQVQFTWQAKIWQRSGQDWKNIPMYLSTLEPRVQLMPRPVSPWEIAPLRPMAMRAKAMAVPAAAFDLDENTLSAHRPLETRQATSALWDMGSVTLPAGETRVLEIEDTSWKAAFIHVLRPAQSADAFVRALCQFEAAKELPQGTALFLMEGSLVGKQDFSFSGLETELFFGINPYVQAKVTLKEKKTGEKGLIKQKQTFMRKWKIAVSNAGETPVAVRVEEAKPQSRDERIALEFTTTPEARQDADSPETIFWESTLPARGEKTFHVNMQFSAPEDMRIDPGWQW